MIYIAEKYHNANKNLRIFQGYPREGGFE